MQSRRAPCQCENEVKRCFEKVRTWPLAKDKLHFSADAKDDLVEHWCEMLLGFVSAPFALLL